MKKILAVLVLFSSFNSFAQENVTSPSVADKSDTTCERAAWDCDLCPTPACGPHCWN